MAKNQSLPAHLQEKDSRGENNSTMCELHEKSTAWWPGPSLFKPTLYKSYCEGSFMYEPNIIIGPQKNRVPT